ncbi:MAG TPA: HAD family hydrolase [Candidatus Polarisedimenticolaceae bacterium]|nr:HAD family hydrolase [Candidatus Polarisedimenticolaceae bacterium]
MRPTLVLFDIDGTLVDTAGAGRRGLAASFRTVFGVQDIDGPIARVPFGGRSDPAIIAEIGREAGVAPGEIEARYVELQTAYLAALRRELSTADARRRVMPGVRPLLDRLAARPDVFVGLVTGNVEEGARTKLDAFGLNPYFIDGGYSSDHPERPEIARIAHQRFSRRAGFRFPPDRVMVIGDTELDVHCARANGFVAIAVESGWASRDRLASAAPDALFADLVDTEEVLGAMGLVDA